MKILFIAHYFQPEPNFFVGLPFAKALRDRGHQVQVLTGLPNYPGGRIYDGYKVRPIQREVMDGIEIIRVPLYPSHSRSSIKRILSYMSLSLTQAAIGTFAVDKADVAFVSQGPATIGLPAITHKFFRKIPFVYNIQDLWPDSLLSSGMFKNQKGLKMVYWWCNYIYKRAAKVVVISPGFKRLLCERGVPADKIEVIYNWCDEDQVLKTEKSEEILREFGMVGKFNIIFAGNMGRAQAMSSVLDAAELIKDSYPEIQFIFIGSGVEVDILKEKARNMDISNVRFHKRRPVSEIGTILSLADVLLAHLKDEPIYSITVPSKTQAYLAMGKPVLIGIRGDASDLIKKAGAGVACEPENPKSIADKAIELYKTPRENLEKMGVNGKEFYEKNLSFDIATCRYENIFASVVGKMKK